MNQKISNARPWRPRQVLLIILVISIGVSLSPLGIALRHARIWLALDAFVSLDTPPFSQCQGLKIDPVPGRYYPIFWGPPTLEPIHRYWLVHCTEGYGGLLWHDPPIALVDTSACMLLEPITIYMDWGLERKKFRPFYDRPMPICP